MSEITSLILQYLTFSKELHFQLEKLSIVLVSVLICRVNLVLPLFIYSPAICASFCTSIKAVQNVSYVLVIYANPCCLAWWLLWCLDMAMCHMIAVTIRILLALLDKFCTRD